MRISSREWRGEPWFDGVLVALLAHGVAVVALGVVVGRHATRAERSPRVTWREPVEQLRFIAPAAVTTVPRLLVQSDRQSRRRPTPGPLRGSPLSARDTGAAIATSPPAVVSSATLLASPLGRDSRLLVGPGAATVAEVRVREANASIAAAVRAHEDSAYRRDLGWTVGDSTHRFGIAPCGIRISKICIPFGFKSMPNSSDPAFSAVDRDRAKDAEVEAAIARVRAMNSKP